MARILVVEDEKVVAIDLCERLSREGYDICGPLRDAQSTVEFTDGESVDLVLMDIQLDGDVDGIEAAERLRNKHATPIVFLTASSDRDSIERAKKVNPSGYVLKPFNEQDLLITVEMALSNAELERRVSRQERLLRRTLENVPTAIATLSSAGRIEIANRALASLVGEESSDALSGAVFESAVPLTPESADERGSVRATLTTRTGARVPVEYTEEDLGDGHGKVVSILDLHLREEYEKALIEAARQADQSSKARSRFLSNVSHELRTPLNSIMGMSDLAFDLATDTTQREYLQILKGASENLLQLITSILNYTRVQDDRMPVEEKETDLAQFVTSVVHALSTMAVRSDNGIHVVISPESPRTVLVDEECVRQMLMNIGGNATKFTRHGNIEFQVERVEESLVFRFIDDGPGIPAEDLDRIFEPFSQVLADQIREEGGSGIGLSIAKSLASQIGAQIKVASEVGTGSTFSVVLALKRQGAEGIETAFPSFSGNFEVYSSSQSDGFHRSVRSICALFDIPYCGVVDTTGSEPNGSESGAGPRKLLVLDFERDSDHEQAIHFAYRYHEVVAVARNERSIPQTEGEITWLVGPLLPDRFGALLRDILAHSGSQHPHSHTIDRARKQLPDRSPNPRVVLLVEDEAVNRMVNRRILERFGHTVYSAADGKECLQVLRERDVDLVLMDLRMPGMTGLEAAERIRSGEISGNAGVPIVALTAYAFDTERAAAMESGMNGFVVKPFASEDLYNAVETYASRSTADEKGKPDSAGPEEKRSGDTAVSRSSSLSGSDTIRDLAEEVCKLTSGDELSHIGARTNTLRKEAVNDDEISHLLFRLMLSCRRADVASSRKVAERLLAMAKEGKL